VNPDPDGTRKAEAGFAAVQFKKNNNDYEGRLTLFQPSKKQVKTTFLLEVW
jgi:hypothetical protein